MDFAEAFVMLEHAVAFNECEDLDIPQAQEMMAFAADTLGLDCPPTVPRICIDDEMTGKVLGNFVVSIKIITLKSWNGTARDQSILAHELAHYIQRQTLLRRAGREGQARMAGERIDMMNSAWSGGYVHTTSSDARACNCVGPQNGKPRCPCMMRGLQQINGRWVEVIDHGPVKEEHKFDWGTEKLLKEAIAKMRDEQAQSIG